MDRINRSEDADMIRRVFAFADAYGAPPEVANWLLGLALRRQRVTPIPLESGLGKAFRGDLGISDKPRVEISRLERPGGQTSA